MGFIRKFLQIPSKEDLNGIRLSPGMTWEVSGDIDSEIFFKAVPGFFLTAILYIVFSYIT